MDLKKLAFLLAALGALLAGCSITAGRPEAAGQQAQWDAMRQEALKQYRVVIDDDGCDFTEYPKDLPLTRENIYAQMLDAVKGSQVDTVSFCPFSVGHRLATRSLVTDIHTGPSAQDTTRNLTPELLALGTDTMQMAVEFCRQNHLKVWANFRVNDVHDSWHPQWLYGIKKEHPEQLMGSPDNPPPNGHWSGFDFARPEVRQRARAICNELLSQYDVDGIELDFNRFPMFFKSAAWGKQVSRSEVAAMNQLLRDIRADADRIGKIRNRYLVIAARTHDSAAAALAIGLDLETWMKEGLIDIFISGSDNGYYSSYADAVALGHRYGVKVFPSVDTSWLGGGRSSTPAFVAQSAAALNAGADGVFYFNMFYAKRYIPMMRGQLDELRLMDKRYYGYYQQLNHFIQPNRNTMQGDLLWDRRGDRMCISPNHPVARMEMEIGDDFSRPEVRAAQPRLTLWVEAGTGPRRGLLARVNEHPLGTPAGTGGNYEFDVPPGYLHPGANVFEFTLDDLSDQATATSLVIMKGDQLLKGKLQPPWRRLWTAHDFPNAEAIVDGSCRMVDSGDGTYRENLLYPIVPLDGQLSCEFDLMVESTTAPEAVGFRIANGRFVELLCFEPHAVSLKFQGESFPCDTIGAFHHYRVEADGSRLRIAVDGQPLAEVTMAMPVDNDAGRLTENHTTIEFMHDSSVALGSFSGPGKSSSRWKNVTLNLPYVRLKDAALELTFGQRQ